MLEVPGSILGGDLQFSFFLLVEKNFDDCDCLNGSDRLRNGNLQAREHCGCTESLTAGNCRILTFRLPLKLSAIRLIFIILVF